SHLWVLQALADGAKVLSSEQAIRNKQLNEKGYAYDRFKSTVERGGVERGRWFAWALPVSRIPGNKMRGTRCFAHLTDLS
ncbi:MAG: hypothetical protein WBA57_21680, partial [Elainellaceae cyanobacterium]